MLSLVDLEGMLSVFIPVGDLQMILAADRFGYGKAEAGRFLFLASLVEAFENMLAVEGSILARVRDGQRAGADLYADVSLLPVVRERIFQQVGDERLRQRFVHRDR